MAMMGCPRVCGKEQRPCAGRKNCREMTAVRSRLPLKRLHDCVKKSFSGSSVRSYYIILCLCLIVTVHGEIVFAVFGNRIRNQTVIRFFELLVALTFDQKQEKKISQQAKDLCKQKS